MAMVTVQVWDATGNKRQDVEMPDDAPVNRIMAVLLERMKFPLYSPDGQPMSYKFHHRASGKQLLDDQTLADVGVKPGDVLRLQPEITAGFGISAEVKPSARFDSSAAAEFDWTVIGSFNSTRQLNISSASPIRSSRSTPAEHQAGVLLML
jgi:uncharacterized ubiquitin-like protein YukD